MKNFLLFPFILMMLLFVGNALAYTAPPPPDKGGYVLDQTGRMSVRDIQDLNRKIDQVSKATKNEFGCVLLQDMGGDNIETVAGAIFHSWGIGKHGLDNGILILVSLKEHKSRIETGKGVEGEVTDLQASDILKKNLNPKLKTGDFAGAFSNTVDALGSLLESRANQQATPVPPTPQSDSIPVATATTAGTTSSGGHGGIVVLAALSIFGLIGLAMWLSARSRRREEKEWQEQLRQQANRRRLDREAEILKQRDLKVSTPFVAVPEIRRSSPAPTVHHHTASSSHVATPSRPLTKARAVAAATAMAATLAATETSRLARQREDEAAERRRERERKREDEERRQRERDEEDRRRRRDDDDSSSSSSGSFDWGGSSGGSDDSGGFGGGDSGGGGASGDW